MSLGSECTCSIVDSTVVLISIAARARATTYVRPRPRAPLGGNEAREAKEAREQVAGWTNKDTRG